MHFKAIQSVKNIQLMSCFQPQVCECMLQSDGGNPLTQSDGAARPGQAFKAVKAVNIQLMQRYQPQVTDY